MGDFASHNFYNQYNEGYRSPLAAKYFSQKLKGIEDKAAVWFDVPNSRGPEGYNKDGGKRWRSIEGEVIAEKTNTWIKSRESSAEFMQELTGDSKHAGLSFGIISFYKSGYYQARAFNQNENNRSTLYWNPDLIVNHSENTKITFNTANKSATYKVLLEGITTDGTPFKSETYFEVN